jgi:hypothetical protein
MMAGCLGKFLSNKFYLCIYNTHVPKKNLINTIKNELSATFVSFEIIVYLAILDINLSCRFEFSAEVHLQVRYKVSIT